MSVCIGEEDWELSDFELVSLSLRDRVAQKDQAYRFSPRYN